VAYRPLAEVPASVTPETVERDLIFVGLLGNDRPAAAEVIEALKVARGAGLKSVMVTGTTRTLPRPSPAILAS